MSCLPDFNGLDFNDTDFNTSVWAKRVNDFLFYITPDYFKINDSYKDKDQRGIFERYQYVFGEEMDYNVVPYIDCLLDIANAKETNENMLNHIADSLGSPTDIFIDNDQYRTILSIMVSLYNVKGTLKYIETYFYILGFDITIIKGTIDVSSYIYDNGGIYDNNNTYDSKICPICFPYSANISTNINYTGGGVTAEDLIQLEKILVEQQPLNSNLTAFNLI